MANPNTGWMWTQAFDLIDEADRLHRQFFRLTVSQREEATWQPPVDVFEDEREFLVVVAMPGVTAEGVQVFREPGGQPGGQPGALLVRGVRPVPLTGARQRVRHLEIPYGAFERRIPLPQAGLDLGTPELIQGCLYVRLRKT